jgi:hypothetical protein
MRLLWPFGEYGLGQPTPPSGYFGSVRWVKLVTLILVWGTGLLVVSVAGYLVARL